MSSLSQRLLDSGSSAARRLAAHMGRSNGNVRRYAETLVALEEAGANPETVAKHDRHADVLLKRVKRGEVQENAARALLRQLHEEVSDDEANMSFLMKDGSHGKFITKLKRAFHFKVHHFDEVGNGVYVYLDPENSKILGDALDNTETIFNDLADDLGYLLLRRGNVEDGTYGHFGDNALSTWIFVQVSRPGSGPDDLEGKNFTVKQFANIEKALKEAFGDEPDDHEDETGVYDD